MVGLASGRGSPVLIMALLLGAFALVAGFVSIMSRAVLPVLPVYVGFISSAPHSDVDDLRRGRRTTAASWFITGLGVVFVVEGALASVFGAVMLSHLDLVTRTACLSVILTARSLRAGRIELRSDDLSSFEGDRARLGRLLVGMRFAFAWTSSISPLLVSLLLVAASRGSLTVGAELFALYSLGLATALVALAWTSG